jgi:hypothetical protein
MPARPLWATKGDAAQTAMFHNGAVPCNEFVPPYTIKGPLL